MSVSATTRDLATVDEGFLRAQRDQLVALRASYCQQAEQLSATAAEVTEDGSPNDIVDEGGFGEAGTRQAEHERMLALASHAAARIDEIEGALARLDAGAYGTCMRCHQSIDPARLEALPEAVLCVGCKGGSRLRR